MKEILFAAMLLALFSCSKENNNDAAPVKGDILLVTRIANSDGTSGSAYMQLLPNTEPRTTTNKTSLPASYSVPPVVIGNEIYQLPGFGMQTDLLTRNTIEGDYFSKEQSFLLPAKSGAVSILKHNNKLYVSLIFLGKILILDHQKMEKIGEIDMSQYGIGDKNPDPAIMLIRDNLLYVGLNQMVGGYTPTAERAKADIAIIDTKTDKILKMITQEDAHFSMPTKPEADEKSIFMDEKKDIYINCISGFGGLNQKSGFLRIQAGETEFDNSYALDVTTTNIKNGKHSPSYLIHIQYHKDGVLYATGNVDQYYSNPPSYTKDKTVGSYKVDLYNKTITKLDLPQSNNFGASVNIIGDKVFFGLSTETGNGFYTYDTKTEACSKKPIINTTGYPAEIIKIKK
ncbi:hypothetical protein K4L44_04840 [Halosquirtibacter laminarini]|uniref:Uncharacterized protein n=1 Tax=Halosquirtibacter laminarini TaxID=3374600 RepID=A0AC61NQ46_9BACT|nr:hypothetical protein K4L44_04840 [Prolixibacteraceae bacterium]